MCGIAGAVGLVDDAVIDAVRRMSDCQRHRGPDGHGCWSSPADAQGAGVALTHRRLAIIDLTPDGAQPMIDEASGCVIIFNGEIYNFQSLRSELEAEGVSFRSRCDTEVLLKAYVRWGADCVKRLRGMFAFAIWDARESKLFTARDRLGIKPLYYWMGRHGGGTCLLFASELRALLQTNLVPRKLDPSGLASFVWNGFVVGPGSIVKGIELLPAGCTMVVARDGTIEAQDRYWRLPEAAAPRSPGANADDAVEGLRDALHEAVRLRLISDVPLGVFLSGGIDSSAVSALAVKAGSGNVQTFNIAFEEAGFDESAHARRVAHALGTQHHELRLTQELFRRGLDDALQSIDQPTFDAINTYFVSRAVREAGITVALAGTGGDELFGGYRSFVDLPNAIAWTRRSRALPRPLRRVAGQAVTWLRTGRAGSLPPQTRWGKLTDVLMAQRGLPELYQIAYALFTREFFGELLAVTAPGVEDGLPPSAELPVASDRPEDLLHRISMLELTFFIGQRLLRDTDSASMAVSLEARVPLLDHEVVARAAEVPAARRFHPLGAKRLLRELAMPELDPALFDRPKSGFVLPIEVWCRQQLAEDVRSLLHDSHLSQSVGLDPAAVARLSDAFQQGVPGIYWSRVWALFSLLWWCRQYEVAL